MKFQTQNPPTSITFPVLAKTKKYDRITLFFSETTGFDIEHPSRPELVGVYIKDYISVTNNKTWEILPRGTKVTLIQE